ncbi:hypothetical protein DVH24_032802, partial [Malus domestica]
LLILCLGLGLVSSLAVARRLVCGRREVLRRQHENLAARIVRWRCGRDFGFNGFDGFEFNGAKLNLQTNDICTQPASMPPLCPVSNVLATIVNLAARLAKKAEARAIFMLAADERSLHNVDDSLMLLTTLSPS